MREPMGTATPRHALKTRHDDKVANVRQVERDRREAYRLVDIRDGNKCRACGAKVSVFDVNPDRRKEHHHIRGRGFKGAETTANICLLCKACHDIRHVKRTITITGNADQVLTFEGRGTTWNG